MFERSSRPCFDVPSGSRYCHVCLLGPFRRHPLDRRRPDTPDPALASDLISTLDAGGVARILVRNAARLDDFP